MKPRRALPHMQDLGGSTCNVLSLLNAVWEPGGACEGNPHETGCRKKKKSVALHQLVCLLLPFLFRPPGVWN